MLRTLLLAVLIAPLGGCPAPAEVTPGPEVPEGPVIGPGTAPSADTEEARTDLAEARARWARAGLDAYEMTLQRICFCPMPDYTGPFSVTVRDGELASVRLDGATVDAERGMTVEDLYVLLEEAYDEGAARVTVEYDEALGYPASVSIDYNVMMADEEVSYLVSDLTESAE